MSFAKSGTALFMERKKMSESIEERLKKLEKECETFTKTAQLMLSVCRNLEHRVTVIENFLDKAAK